MSRALCLIALLGLLYPLFAQEEPVTSFTFNHVALSVQDVDRSAGFYGNVLGLKEIVNRTEVEGIRWFSLGEGKELHLISVVKDPVSMNKAVHFALTTPDFDRFLEVLRESEIEYSNWPGLAGEVTIRADNTKQLYIQDADGYWIEVNSVASD
jgi:lactoylglutathione lyase